VLRHEITTEKLILRGRKYNKSLWKRRIN